MSKYIDRVEPKEGMQSCSKIYFEVDLEKGLHEAIKLTLENWKYLQMTII